MIQRTKAGQAHLLELAGAVQELESTLAAEADGSSLEPFYERVPGPLRGYVELVYDLRNHPSVRFIEGLLYRSKYYDEAAQSVVFSETTCDGRPFVFSTPRLKSDGGTSRYTFADLPETIDYVLLTHNHQDHVMFETLLQLRHKIRNVVVPRSTGGDRIDPSLKRILQVIGFKQVGEIDALEKIAIGDGYIVGLPFLGEHADLDIRTKMAYYVNLKGHSVVLAADSNNLEPRLYEHLHELIGDVDVLLLGMECDGAPMSWLYGLLLTHPLSRKNDQSRRFNGSTYDKAIAIVGQLRPQQVYVYAMGQEPWCTFLTSIQYTDQSRPIVHANRLVNDCRGRGLTAELLFGHKEIRLP